ncbi:MAG: hypothetical protein JJU29_09185 [Verrucomicrobia bacterium]|nr:hypothetical protein [Verrucomicrobiota bacterium]MCH8514073.1 hypothetical protein [Kiritimatiellia bacterium]
MKGFPWILASGLMMGLASAQVDGFVESRMGTRTQSDPGQDQASIREIRLQLGHVDFYGPFDLELKADFLYDDLDSRRSSVDLERGQGWFDLRSANVSFAPTDWTDVKVGRQVLTWGTGDLLFINDLFPKDWTSFFNGRDVEYLKAPSDAIWLANFVGDWTVDMIWTPRFNADRYLDGDGISFAGGAFTPDNRIHADVPTDSEFAARLSRYVGSAEIAGYLYDGYWKSPGGFDDAGRAQFPRLSVYGASMQWPGLGGLVNLEAGYYDSRDDRDGVDPAAPNSEVRFLAGYSRELRADLSLGIQGYVEWMQDYGDYRDSLPEGRGARDEVRQVTTLRLTRLLMNQNLVLSGFVFASPTDEDGYLRGSVEYKWSDTLTTTVGGNWFVGRDSDTFFGQLEDNSNLYVAIRRWF